MVVKVYRGERKVGESKPRLVDVGPFEGTLSIKVNVHFSHSDEYRAEAYVVEARSVNAFVHQFSIQGNCVSFTS